jgi:hypothetical protein
MATFSFNVVRADDLLVLRLEFVNLVLDPDEGQRPRRLVRDAAPADALIIVHLPPQHISEMCVTELASGDVTGIPHAGADRLPSFISDESRLVFRLPETMATLPLTLESLLNWNRFEPVLALDEDTAPLDLPVPRVPTGHETAIELPFRLVLSPDRRATWTHRTEPFAHDGRSELWTTRLTPPPASTPGPALVAARTRAIWSPDLSPATAIPNQFLMSLSSTDRAEITRLSSDFRILATDQFSTPPPVQPEYVPLALQTQQLMLSALGGWLRVSSQFDFPTLGPLLQLLRGHESNPGSELFDIQEWSHAAAMGRDQYVRTVRRGCLYPFGHRGSLVIISERRFTPATGPVDERPAYLVQRSVIVPHEPERLYFHRETPFTKVKITTVSTPLLDVHPDAGPFVPRVGGTPFGFAVTATDREGRLVDFAGPMVFIPDGGMSLLSDAQRQYQAVAPAELFNQQVAFASTGTTAIADQPGPSTAKTASIQFDHKDAAEEFPPFLPTMRWAMVRLPAAELLLSEAQTSVGKRIEYHPDFAAGRETHGVFAKIVDGLPLAFPADKAGGIAAPALAMTGLSLQHGAVPNASDLAAGTFARALDGLGGELLGVIKLKDIVAAVARPEDLPQLRIDPTRERLLVTFDWAPRLVDAGPASEVLILDASSALHLKGTLIRPLDGSASTSDMQGTLSRFGLSFARVLRVDFDELSFRMVTGQKPSFGVKVKDFTFDGDLRFLNPLTAELKKISEGFGPAMGPAIAITPAGVSATLTLALPSVSLGVLNLQNVAVVAGVSLFFAGQPAELTFGLSKRESPFLISYSVFGGGGFFALTLRTGRLSPTDRRVAITASLEFGAIVALDLVLAKGVAQVMAGIVFGMDGDDVSLTGSLRIHGCLEVLRIVSISVDVQLTLRYDVATNKATAKGKLVVQVRVLAFSQSVTLEVERSFSTKNDPPTPRHRFLETLDDAQWDAYCQAFA